MGGRGGGVAVGRGRGSELLLLLLVGIDAVHLVVPGSDLVGIILGRALLHDSGMGVHKVGAVVKLHGVWLINGSHGGVLKRDACWALDDHGAGACAMSGRTGDDGLKMEWGVVVDVVVDVIIDVVSKRSDIGAADQDIVERVASARGGDDGGLREIVVAKVVACIVSSVLFLDGTGVDDFYFTGEDHLEGLTPDWFFYARKTGTITPLV